MAKMRFEVVIDVPPDFNLTREEVAVYVLDAVQSWKGGLNPSSDLFDLDYKKMSVKDPNTKTRYVNND